MSSRSASTYRLAAVLGCLLLVGLVPAASASASELSVRFCGLENREGNLRIAVFSREHAKEFTEPDSRAFTVGLNLRLADLEYTSTLSVVLPSLAPGDYALRVIHDENSNGEFDLGGLLGTPQESYGYSRNARARVSAVDFDDAVVTLGREPLSIDVRIVSWGLTGGDTSPCPP
jgi:uncharacterized protein (DUF2141 family)